MGNLNSIKQTKHYKTSEAIEGYYKQTSFSKKIVWGSLLLIILFFFYALNKGAAQISPQEVLRALWGTETGLAQVVLWGNRLPRVLAAIIAGAGLALAGCVMQTCLANPLASPSTLGISNAAAFGANIAIAYFAAGSVTAIGDGVFINNPYSVTFFAFTFSLLATLIILALAKLKDLSPEAIVLVGVALNSLFAAGSTLIQYFATDSQIAAMVFWTFGDIGRVSWSEVKILLIVTSFSFIYFLFKRWDLNACDSGEDSAKSLGVNVERLRFTMMLISSLLTAVVVSFMGTIAFVGLVAPHIMRRIIGRDHRFLIPATATTGALILLFSDTVARTIISPIVLPVGAITSFLGAPLFLFLLMRGYSKQ